MAKYYLGYINTISIRVHEYVLQYGTLIILILGKRIRFIYGVYMGYIVLKKLGYRSYIFRVQFVLYHMHPDKGTAIRTMYVGHGLYPNFRCQCTIIFYSVVSALCALLPDYYDIYHVSK